MATLTSKRHKVEDLDATEFCFQQGWTDGLPVVPPTEDRVWAMLKAADLKPEDQVGYIENRAVAVSAEKGVLMIVNGPIARQLDVNAGDNLFGPGWRANATIGRAVRLVMRNIAGSRPG